MAQAVTALSQVVTAEEGNTLPPQRVKKAGPRSRKWCFTINNPTEVDLSHLSQALRGARLWVYQKEAGAEGTPHIQGFGEWKEAMRFETLQSILKRAHLEVTKGTAEQNLIYCTKEEGRLEGPWKGGEWPTPPEPLEVFEPRGWMLPFVEKLKTKPDHRSIIWIWENVGNIGKTCFAKFLCAKMGALYVSGKASDVKMAVAELVKAGKPPKIVIFGFPRCVEDYVSYQAIEEVKDGLFFSGKYESGMVMYNPPHVIILANFEPDRSKLSGDRWEVHNIDPILGALGAPVDLKLNEL